MLKFAAAGMLVGLFASLVGDVVTWVGACGAAAMGLAFFWGKVIVPLVDLQKVLKGLPPWMEKVDGWMDEAGQQLGRGHEHFERIEERLDRLEEPAVAAAESATAVARELDVHSRG